MDPNASALTDLIAVDQSNAQRPPIPPLTRVQRAEQAVVIRQLIRLFSAWQQVFRAKVLARKKLLIRYWRRMIDYRQLFKDAKPARAELAAPKVHRVPEPLKEPVVVNHNRRMSKTPERRRSTSVGPHYPTPKDIATQLRRSRSPAKSKSPHRRSSANSTASQSPNGSQEIFPRNIYSLLNASLGDDQQPSAQLIAVPEQQPHGQGAMTMDDLQSKSPSPPPPPPWSPRASTARTGGNQLLTVLARLKAANMLPTKRSPRQKSPEVVLQLPEPVPVPVQPAPLLQPAPVRVPVPVPVALVTSNLVSVPSWSAPSPSSPVVSGMSNKPERKVRRSFQLNTVPIVPEAPAPAVASAAMAQRHVQKPPAVDPIISRKASIPTMSQPAVSVPVPVSAHPVEEEEEGLQANQRRALHRCFLRLQSILWAGNRSAEGYALAAYHHKLCLKQSALRHWLSMPRRPRRQTAPCSPRKAIHSLFHNASSNVSKYYWERWRARTASSNAFLSQERELTADAHWRQRNLSRAFRQYVNFIDQQRERMRIYMEQADLQAEEQGMEEGEQGAQVDGMGEDVGEDGQPAGQEEYDSDWEAQYDDMDGAEELSIDLGMPLEQLDQYESDDGYYQQMAQDDEQLTESPTPSPVPLEYEQYESDNERYQEQQEYEGGQLNASNYDDYDDGESMDTSTGSAAVHPVQIVEVVLPAAHRRRPAQPADPAPAALIPVPHALPPKAPTQPVQAVLNGVDCDLTEDSHDPHKRNSFLLPALMGLEDDDESSVVVCSNPAFLQRPHEDAEDEMSFCISSSSSSCGEDCGYDLDHAKSILCQFIWTVAVLRGFVLQCRGRLYHRQKLRRHALYHMLGQVMKRSIDAEVMAIGGHHGEDKMCLRLLRRWCWKMRRKKRLYGL